MDDLTRLSIHLDRAAMRAPGKVRGVLGRGVDRAAKDAKSIARGRGWSKDTVDGIYARMAKGTSGTPTAYVFATGPAAYQETGTSRHGPQPTITPAALAQEERIAEELLKIADDL